MQGPLFRWFALGALVLGGLTLAGCCEDCPRPREFYPKPSGAPGSGPQLGTGTFEARQPGTEYPVAWSWRHPDHLDSEVWVMYKPGDTGGFARYGSGPGSDSYLTLKHFPWVDYGTNDPAPGMGGTSAFVTFVVGRYLSEYEMTVPATDLDVRVYKTGGTTSAPSSVGAFEPGLYKVWQTNHIPYVGPPVAWVWRPAAPGNREIWLAYEKKTTWGYHLPGADHPDVSGMPYKLAEFRFQKFPDELSSGGATITGTPAQYDAAMAMFKDWVMRDVTNDVLDPAEIEDPMGPPPSKVLYDHRIQQGP